MTGTNLTVHCGASFTVSFTCKDDQGAVVDITGYTARSEARATAADETAVFDFSPTIPTGTDGVILIDLSPETTSTLITGVFIWDIVLEDPFGNIIPITGGTVKVRPMSTKFPTP